VLSCYRFVYFVSYLEPTAIHRRPMMQLDDGVRRVDLDDETLLLDTAGGRVVRLRDTAREALDGADSRSTRAVIEHLEGIGVLPPDGGPAGSSTADPTRRSVLSASAAAALGITVMALPTAASAVSPGTTTNTQRNGFIQVGEFGSDAFGGAGQPPAPSDITRSFVHGGLIHLLDQSAWRLYIITGTLDAVRAVDISAEGTDLTGFTELVNSSVTDFVIDVASPGQDYAYIAGFRFTDSVRFLDVVRLELPLPQESTYTPTVWSTDLTAGASAPRPLKDLSSVTFSFPGGDRESIPASDLKHSDEPIAVSALAFDFPLELSGLVKLGSDLYCVYRSAPDFVNKLTFFTAFNAGEPDQGGTTDNVSLQLYELVKISSSGVMSFAQIGLEAEVQFDGKFDAEDVGYSSGGLHFDPHRFALVQGSDLLFLGSSGGRQGNNAMLRVSSPAGTPSAVSSLNRWPGYLVRYDRRRTPQAIRLGDDLFVAAEVFSDDDEEGAGLIRVDLADAAFPVTGWFPVPDAYESKGPVATDGTYLYAWVRGDENGVARFLIGPGPTYELSDVQFAPNDGEVFEAHSAQTARPTATGVLTAGTGTAPVATFAFVAPPS
jgi:hypothetical protein